MQIMRKDQPDGAGPSSRSRVWVGLVTLGLLCLVATASQAPTLDRLVNPLGTSSETLVLVLGPDRVVKVAAPEFSDDVRRHTFLRPENLGRGRVVFFVLSDDTGLRVVDGDSIDAWTVALDLQDDRIEIRSPDDSVIRVPLESDAFVLERPGSQDRELTPGVGLEDEGLVFTSDQGRPPAIPAGPSSASRFGAGARIGMLLTVLALGSLVWLIRRRDVSRRVTTDGDMPRPERDEPCVSVPLYATWEEFARFLAELEVMPDPERAIRLAFAYAEAGPGRLPTRGVNETPVEWQARVGRVQPDLVSMLNPLLALYLSVRFGFRMASLADKREAVASLSALVETALIESGFLETALINAAVGD